MMGGGAKKKRKMKDTLLSAFSPGHRHMYHLEEPHACLALTFTRKPKPVWHQLLGYRTKKPSGNTWLKTVASGQVN